MRGYLVLHLLGEHIARDLMNEGVDASTAQAWLTNWDNVCGDGLLARPGNTAVTASLLAYRVRALSQLRPEKDDNGSE